MPLPHHGTNVRTDRRRWRHQLECAVGLNPELAAGPRHAPPPAREQARPSTGGERLPTGVELTPASVPGSVFQTLNPDLPDPPGFEAGQAVTTALGPDGATLLILTSGYNRNNGATGSRVAAWSNEYVFVYDVTTSPPVKRQVLEVPNSFSGLVWNPDGQSFYVSGGVDDRIHVFRPMSST
jgi:hypothetical protein